MSSSFFEKTHLTWISLIPKATQQKFHLFCITIGVMRSTSEKTNTFQKIIQIMNEIPTFSFSDSDPKH